MVFSSIIAASALGLKFLIISEVADEAIDAAGERNIGVLSASWFGGIDARTGLPVASKSIAREGRRRRRRGDKMDMLETEPSASSTIMARGLSSPLRPEEIFRQHSICVSPSLRLSTADSQQRIAVANCGLDHFCDRALVPAASKEVAASCKICLEGGARALVFEFFM